MSDERLDQCRQRLAAIDEAALDVRADALDHVHRALVAELDDLLDGERQR